MSWLSSIARLLAALAIAGAIGLGGTAHGAARSILDLDVQAQPVPLADWGDAWIDPGGATTVDEVAAGHGIEWTPTHPGRAYALEAGQALWIRFSVPPAPDAERWYLEVESRTVDLASLYALDAAGRWNAQSAGDRMPVDSWPVPTRRPLLPIAVSAEEHRKYLLKIHNAGDFDAELHFLSESHLSQRNQRAFLWLGIYFGCSALALVTAACMSALFRDRPSAAAAVSVLLVSLWQAAESGIGPLYLWNDLPKWTDVAPSVLFVLAAGSLTLTFGSILALRDRAADTGLWLLAWCLSSLPVAAMCAWIDPAARQFVVGAHAAATDAILLAMVFWAMRRGGTGVAALAITACFGAGVTALPLAAAFGWAREPGMHELLPPLATAALWPALLVALLVRNRERRETTRRIESLPRLDPGTGVVNAAEFSRRLARLIARAGREGHDALVMVVDVPNAVALNEEFASLAAELPVQVAHRLLCGIRDIDTVGRLSDQRFAVLIEGPLAPQEITCVAARAIARSLIPFPDKPIAWLPKLRIAQAKLPAPQLTADELLARLNDLLSSCRAGERKAVFTLQVDDTGAARPGGAPPGGVRIPIRRVFGRDVAERELPRVDA